jgi:hypothetical protein
LIAVALLAVLAVTCAYVSSQAKIIPFATITEIILIFLLACFGLAIAVELFYQWQDMRRRRAFRFQFRLRTLLLAVTVFCVFGGWVLSQAKIVWDRKATLKRITEERHASAMTSLPRLGEPHPIPWLRRLFGDEMITTIVIPKDTPLEERASLRAEFPEAKLYWPEADPRGWDNLHRFPQGADKADHE